MRPSATNGFVSAGVPAEPPNELPAASATNGFAPAGEGADSPNELTAASGTDSFARALKALLHWFHSHARQLPWRDIPTPYRVWVSEMMLQQTQVATVLPYFSRFMNAFPTPEALAAAPEEAVLAAWSGLGYYSRARNLHAAARLLFENGNRGQLPDSRRALEALPGIGPYTAGALLSIAFGRYEAILDGNAERIFARLLQIPKDRAWKRRLWALSRLFIRKAEQLSLPASALNQALMELGALVCRPSAPQCADCPLRPKCQSFKRGTVLLYPQRSPRIVPEAISETVMCCADNEGRWLLQQDAGARWRRGAWDFPESLPFFGENPAFFSEVFPEKPLPAVHLTVTRYRIERRFRLFRLTAAALPPSPDSSLRYGWFLPDEVPALPTAAPLLKSLRLLKQNGCLP